MSFFQPKFLGLSVRDIKTSLGCNQQISQLNVQLVQDIIYGDMYDGTTIGAPVYFEFGNFIFTGILQSFKTSNSTNGLPVYDVNIIDPRDILDGAQVITSSFTGVIPGGIKNIFNVYGYWENLGFGGSGSTQAGMPWDKVVNGILAMANNPVAGSYGGPLQFKGYSYSLDLSEVPRPPGYYRLPTGYLSLLEVIHFLCEDSGCDFYVILTGTTIKVKVISRFFQPPLGTINSLVLSNTYSGSTISAEAGIESRCEVGSILLIGGEKTGIYITDTIYSYWGTDINGAPVIGEAGTFSPFGACEYANLNAADCSDIVGSTTYRCSTIELRFALWGVETWMSFLAKHRTTIAAFIGAGIYGDNGVTTPKLAVDLVADAAANMTLAVDEVLSERRARLYDLVHRYAEDFYGKQFLVTVDGVQASQDSETGQITTSDEPTNAGYMEFGAASLGVPANRLDVLQESDERVVSFAYWSSIVGADLSRINWSETAVDDAGKMWARTQTDSRILFLGAVPYIHVKLGGALYEPKDDVFGNATDAGRNFAVNGADLVTVNNNAFGGTIGHIGIHPAARFPTALGIPLKSNILTYGPWYIAGSAGKVKVEQDTSLTPWDYGSATVMDLAGEARVQTCLTNQTLNESGSLNVVGAPAYSIGEIMVAGGPNLTNIEIGFGPQGITTSYRWQTFTPKFGLFSRQNSERLRRVSLSQVQSRRDFRKALNRAIVAKTIVDKAVRGAKFNKAFWEKKQSPSTVIMAQGVTDGSDTRVGCGFETYESALTMLNQGSNFTDKAVMSVSGLIRGFSTNPSATSKLSKYITLGSFTGTNANSLTRTTFDPFTTGSDIEILTWGNTYAGANAYRRGNTSDNTRAIALRGPLVVSGWGPGVDGNFYPSGGASYVANARKRSDLWSTGPVDLLWEPKRGVWTSHDIYSGVTSGSIVSGGTGTVKIGNDAGWTMSVYNQWSSTIATAKKCLIGYCVNEHRFQFIAVDC